MILSHLEALKRDIQGLVLETVLETEKLNKDQGRYQVLKSLRIKRNLDQDHTPEEEDQNHIPKKDTAKEAFQSHDHVPVLDPGPGLDHVYALGLGQLDVLGLDHIDALSLGHLDVLGQGHLGVGDHAQGHVGDLLYLEITFEGFPLAGEEEWAPLGDVGQDHAPGLVAQEEEVYQGGGSHVQDLEKEGHVQDQGKEDGRDPGQNPALTQGIKKVRVRAGLGQSQTKKSCLVALYQLLIPQQ